MNVFRQVVVCETYVPKPVDRNIKAVGSSTRVSFSPSKARNFPNMKFPSMKSLLSIVK